MRLPLVFGSRSLWARRAREAVPGGRRAVLRGGVRKLDAGLRQILAAISHDPLSATPS